MDQLGIVRELQERQEAIASRLSPAARHQAFPNKYARPVPREARVMEDPTKPLRAEIALLKEELANVKRENGRLTILLREKSRPFEDRVEPSIREVMDEFCRAMNESGRNIDGEPWSDVILKTKRSTWNISHPRHVCMWLIRKICPSPSLPMIGAAFGGKDHTTIMHGCQTAHERMDADPGLRHVAITVFRKFGVSTAVLEKGEQP